MAIHSNERHDRLRRAGDWLKTMRDAQGLTQGELARMIGSSTQNISNYETAKAGISDETAKKIADALGLSEVETRRGLGLYVPSDASDQPPGPIDVLAAIRNDTTLLPEAKRHLLNQYQLLRRIAPQATVTPLRPDSADHLDKPAVARKRTPKRPT